MCRLLLIGLILICSSITTAEAQTLSGRGIFNENANTYVDNACHVRINDLRISIQSLTDDINDIRNCSAQGKIPMRSGGSIICRDVILGHHEIQGGGTDVRFFNDKGSSGWGSKGYMVGKKGEAGKNVRCDCTSTWGMPSCQPGDSGTVFYPQACSTGNPSDCITCQGPAQVVPISCTCSLSGTWEDPVCPAGFVGEHTAAQTCSSFGQCCGTAKSVAVQCGTPAVEEPEITYSYTDWTACSGGTQTRACAGSDGQTVACSFCGGQCSRTCTMPCSSYTWQASGSWGACTKSCGSGIQTRPGACRCDQTGETVSNSLCALAEREQACNTQSCATGTWVANTTACSAQPRWEESAWGSCSTTCGGGTQTRPVTCAGDTGTRTTTYTCSSSGGCAAPQPAASTEACTLACTAGSKPAATQACNTEACKTGTWVAQSCSANPQWAFGNWGNCSATCGGGTKSRSVTCTNTTGTQAFACSTSSGCAAPQPTPQSCTTNCNAATKPDATASCNTQGCILGCCPRPPGAHGDCECVGNSAQSIGWWRCYGHSGSVIDWQCE